MGKEKKKDKERKAQSEVDNEDTSPTEPINLNESVEVPSKETEPQVDTSHHRSSRSKRSQPIQPVEEDPQEEIDFEPETPEKPDIIAEEETSQAQIQEEEESRNKKMDTAVHHPASNPTPKLSLVNPTLLTTTPPKQQSTKAVAWPTIQYPNPLEGSIGEHPYIKLGETIAQPQDAQQNRHQMVNNSWQKGRPQQQTVAVQNIPKISPLQNLTEGEDIERWIHSVEKASAGGMEWNIEALMTRECSKSVPLRLSLAMKRHSKAIYSHLSEDKWKEWSWDEIKAAFQDIAKDILRAVPGDVIPGIDSLLLQAGRIPPYPPFNMKTLDKDTVQFQLGIVQLHEDYEEVFHNLNATQKAEVLMELVHRICRKPDINLNHPSRHLAAKLARCIPQMNSLLQFSKEVGFEADKYREDFINQTHKFGSGVAYNIPPLPYDAQPKVYSEKDSPYEPLKGPSRSSHDNQKKRKRDDVTTNKNASSSQQNKQMRKQTVAGFSDNESVTDDTSVEGPSLRTPPPLRGSNLDDPKATDVWLCYICGHVHNRNRCFLRTHPNANHQEDRPWSESNVGRQWKEKNESQLPANKTLAGKKVELPEFIKGMREMRKNKAQGAKKFKHRKH